MPITSVAQYSTTPANNTDLGGMLIGNNQMEPGQVDNALRELMAHIAAYRDSLTTSWTAAFATKAPIGMTISTAGLATGGGDLSANRTITVPAASQAEAQAGTDNSKAMTPLRVAQAIAALGAGGPSDIASITGLQAALDAKATELSRIQINSNTTAFAGYLYLCNMHLGPYTLTLPASPAQGARVGVSVGSGVETNALTINPNGNYFDGATTSFTVSVPAVLVFEYRSSEWRLSV
jgi:hypothetical protein